MSADADRCEVCEATLTREEVKRSLGLCDKCARDVDEGYEARRDDLYWPGWFGEE